MFWIGGLSWRFSVSSGWWFLKTDLLKFHHISLLFDKSNPLIFQMCFIRRHIVYLCPNMTNFAVVDFSERRSGEVISFFWRSVYIYLYLLLCFIGFVSCLFVIYIFFLLSIVAISWYTAEITFWEIYVLIWIFFVLSRFCLSLLFWNKKLCTEMHQLFFVWAQGKFFRLISILKFEHVYKY